MNLERFTPRADHQPSRGFSLIEVALALGIAAFVLMVLLGMLPIGLTNHQNAERETLATSILSTVVTDLKNSATNQPTIILGLTPNPLAAATANATTNYFAENEQLVSQAANALCRVEIRAAAPGTHGRDLHVRVAWPAAAPSGQESGSVETYTFIPSLK